MLQYVRELEGTNVLINAACPGYVATDLNGFHGVRTPEQGAATPIRLATLPDDGPTRRVLRRRRRRPLVTGPAVSGREC